MIKFVRVASFLIAAVVTVFSIFLIDGEQELADAQAALSSGDMDQAIRMARRANRALDDEDKKASAYYVQARAAQKMQWNAKAKQYLTELLEMNENHVSGLLFKGELEYQSGNYTTAIAVLNKGLDLAAGKMSDKNLAYSLANRGLVYLELNELEKAKKDVQKVLQLAPKSHTSLNFLSHFYEKQGNYKKAVEACDKAYKLLLEKDRYAVVSPQGRYYSDRLVELKVKHLQSK